VKSAKWGNGSWDGSRWDTLVCEITGAWASGNDPWTGLIALQDRVYGGWYSKDDAWNGAFRLVNHIQMDLHENIDEWIGGIKISRGSESFVDENRDIWDGLIYITFHQPIYNANSGWIHVWGDRLPTYVERGFIEDLVYAWAYEVSGIIESDDAVVSGRVDTSYVAESQLQRQVELMYGSQEPNYDEDDEEVMSLW
jgi:hypothetical protein